MNQVQINPTKLSILSIHRDKYWIFKSAILEFLHLEAERTKEETYDSDSDTDAEDESLINLNMMKINSKRSSLPDSTSSINSKSKRTSVSSVTSSLERETSNKDVSQDASSKAPQDIISSDTDESLEESYFFHIAFTPIECTLICDEKIMTKLFAEPLKMCEALGFDDIKLIDKTFVNLQIDSGGSSDNNRRILQLTKPLSDNNISLFFLSSHFSDIVLIPDILEQKVINILTNNNFEFSDISGSYIINGNSSPVDESNENSTGLENKVFSVFKHAHIRPIVNKDIPLLLTGSRSNHVIDTILQTANNISKNNVPDYFAITRTSVNEVSLILPKSSHQRSKLGFNSKYLIGSTQDVINPITIDLQSLPIDSTGIVAGVASKIINGVNSFPNYPLELNYLSMARSAILLIPQENIDLVEEILDHIDYDEL